jgi:hypothetical protein
MIAEEELTQLVRTFLETGADEMPERVYRAAFDVVPTTRQRRVWWSRRELRSLPVILRVAPAASLLVVVVLSGIAIMTTGGVGTQTAPAPTFTPTASPSATPTPSTAPSGGPLTGIAPDTTLGEGIYEVGTPFAMPFTLQLPPDTVFRGVEAGSATFATLDGSVEVYLPDAVFSDPCRLAGDAAPVSDADDLVAALTSMSGFSATTPTTTTVAGRSARQFVLTNTVDTATAGCARELMLPLFTYAGHAEGAATNGGQRQVVWVVDVGSTPLLILGDGWHDSRRADLEALIETVRLR